MKCSIITATAGLCVETTHSLPHVMYIAVCSDTGNISHLTVEEVKFRKPLC